MKMTIVGIFDRKAQVFISLEPTPNPAVAVRQLGEIVNREDNNNPIYKWPEDYSLWDLGTYDSETGYVEANTKMVRNKEVHDKRLIMEAGDLRSNKELN